MRSPEADDKLDPVGEANGAVWAMPGSPRLWDKRHVQSEKVIPFSGSLR
jgi:hypothetical protein